jgi:hypothetical protein
VSIGCDCSLVAEVLLVVFASPILLVLTDLLENCVFARSLVFFKSQVLELEFSLLVFTGVAV